MNNKVKNKKDRQMDKLSKKTTICDLKLVVWIKIQKVHKIKKRKEKKGR